jgi:hypothetical protein
LVAEITASCMGKNKKPWLDKKGILFFQELFSHT